MITFNCPECNLLTKAKDREAGSYARCDKCNEPVWVPDEGPFQFKTRSNERGWFFYLTIVMVVMSVIVLLNMLRWAFVAMTN